ncbi:hypothetical protein FHS12_001492 [Nocardioides albus]|uniref:Uncharacterized protein n=1 Tax=Nocardioides albus TaxID=1841 RepID=A0A7W5A2Y0_9ACTN|nr:hypothetical protein [Nocardioides albus]
MHAPLTAHRGMHKAILHTLLVWPTERHARALMPASIGPIGTHSRGTPRCMPWIVHKFTRQCTARSRHAPLTSKSTGYRGMTPSREQPPPPRHSVKDSATVLKSMRLRRFPGLKDAKRPSGPISRLQGALSSVSLPVVSLFSGFRSSRPPRATLAVEWPLWASHGRHGGVIAGVALARRPGERHHDGIAAIGACDPLRFVTHRHLRGWREGRFAAAEQSAARPYPSWRDNPDNGARSAPREDSTGNGCPWLARRSRSGGAPRSSRGRRTSQQPVHRSRCTRDRQRLRARSSPEGA